MPNQPILDGHIQMVIKVMRKAGLQSSPAQLHTSWRKRFKSFEKASVESESTKAAINTLIRMGFTWTGGALLANTSPILSRQLDATNPSA